MILWIQILRIKQLINILYQ